MEQGGVSNEKFEQQTRRLERKNQSHVLKYLEELSLAQKKQLLDEVESVDLELLEDLYEKHYVNPKPEESGSIEPYQNIVDFRDFDQKQRESMKNQGLNIIKQGKAAVLMFAGGSATRLGVPYPKGMYDIGLLSHKSLFQIYAERLQRLQQLAQGPPIPWLIMTNQESLATIQNFFEENFYFGLNRDNVFVFPQDMLPAIDFSGKVLLTEKHKLSLSPNGNGGVFESLGKAGGLEWLEEKEVEYVHLCGVDNVLLKICDPLFLAFTETQAVEVATKAVEKTKWDESVGVFALKAGKKSVVEYSELSEEMAKSKEDSGRLSFCAGNILNHVFRTSFLKKIITNNLSELRDKYHVAKKKVPHLSQEGYQSPTSPNALKFELFYFDALSFAESHAALLINRKEEYAPVKNASGVDSAESAREMVSRLHSKWVKNAGGSIADISTSGCSCEISPLVSYSGEHLQCLQGKNISLPFYLYY